MARVLSDWTPWDFVLKLIGSDRHLVRPRWKRNIRSMPEEAVVGIAEWTIQSPPPSQSSSNGSLLARSALADTVFTPGSGPRCKDESKEGFRQWTCPGPTGYCRALCGRGQYRLADHRARTLDRKGALDSTVAAGGQGLGDRSCGVACAERL